MEEIKFRGKRIDNGRWAYGYYLKTPLTTEFNCDGQFLDSGGVGRYCIAQDNVVHEIDRETVGMFMGTHDRGGAEIYEGDKIDFAGMSAIIVFKEGRFTDDKGVFNFSREGMAMFTKVLGNIHSV